MKRYLSLVMALLLVFGTMTTSFAADLDFINNDDPTKSYSFNEIVKSPTKLIEVAGNLGDYLIEWGGKLYSASEVEALTAGGATFEEAIAQLDPVDAEEPPVEDLEKLFIVLDTTAPDDTIIANGDDNTTVIVKIVDKNGVVDTSANGIVVELFTSHGSFASLAKKSRVTIQNGMGTIKLNSEFSATPITAELTAKLYEASPEYQELIGTKQFVFNVYFKPLGSVGLQAPPVLIAAESNQADRVTLFFDKPVDLEQFEMALWAESEQEFMGLNPAIGVSVKQGFGEWGVVGYLPVKGNNKALVAVLDVEEGPLVDNAWTLVMTTTYSDYGWSDNEVEFLLTDARVPELTRVMVEPDALDEIRLEFSESIWRITNVTIDGGTVDVDGWDINGFDYADWDEDGQFTPFKDYRNYADVFIDGWLTPGEHSVTVTRVFDWAGRTDSKNVSTTQTLDFTIGTNTVVPDFVAVVESPEQIRMTFPSYVEFVDEEYGENWMLQYNLGTEAAPVWTTVPDGKISTFEEVNQVVLEAVEDWTQFFETADNGVNYYNYKWRLHANAGVLRNTKNGVLNAEINRSLNYVGSPLNAEDVTSPKNLLVKQTGDYDFDIYMNEPVKYQGFEETPSQDEITAVEVEVQFIGKNADGVVVTIPGVVNGYGDEYSKDMVISVGEGTTSLQDLVDEDGYAEAWTLNVKRITDDVGNAAETVVYNFNVPKTEDEEPGTQDFWIDYAEFTTDGGIYVQFTDLIKTSGGDQSAVLLSNYSVNNQDLPVGTTIMVDLDSATTIGGLNGYTAVIIVLPEDSDLIESAYSNTLEVAKTLKSKDGDPLKGFSGYPEFTRYQNVIRGVYLP